MPFDVFPIPEQPDALAASTARRLDRMAEARQGTTNELMGNVASSIYAQNRARNSVARTLQRSMNKRIGAIADVRQGFTQLLQNNIGSALSRAVGARAGIAGSLLPSGTVPAGAPVRQVSGRGFPPRLPVINPRPPGGTHPPPQPVPPTQPISNYCTGIGWYILWDPLVGCRSVTCGIVGSYIGGIVLAGPFDTGQLAQDWMDAHHCGPNFKPPTVQPPPPPPPIIQPPPPPDGGNQCPDVPPYPAGCQVSQAGYYCLADANNNISVSYLAAGQPVPDNMTAVDGPFSTLASAQELCAQYSGVVPPCPPTPPCEPCGPPPPEPPPPPPAPTTPTCALIDFGDWQLPPIGSPLFCERIQGLTEVMIAAGQAFITWINSVAQWTQDYITWLQTAPEGEITGFKVVDYAISLLAQFFGPVIQGEIAIITTAINCWADLVSRLGDCDATGIVAVSALRGLVRSLQRVRVGANADLWITIDLTFDVPQWERLLDYLIEYLCPSKVPSVGEAITARMQGQITQELYECYLKLHGVSPDVWKPITLSQAHTITADQVILHGRRLGYQPDDIDQQLTARGWLREEDRVWLQSLYDRLPTPAEAFGWMRGNLYNDEMAGKYGLDQDFGELWDSAIGEWLRAQGITDMVAQYSYRATWTVPNLQAAREYLYRLRPDVMPEGLAFTTTELVEVMDFANLTPLEQAWRSATIYRPLTTADVEQLLLYNRATWSHLKGAYLDSGLSDDNAHRMADLHEITVARQRSQMTGGWTIQRVASLVRTGVMTLQQGVQALDGQGYSYDEISTAVAVNAATYTQRLVERGAMRARMRLVQGALSSYQLGTIDSGQAVSLLRASGWDQPSAETAIVGADLQREQQLVKSLLSTLRSEYLRGGLSRSQVSVYLTGGGLTPASVDHYLHMWDLQRTASRKILSAQQWLRMTFEGLVSANEAAQALSNLGWENPERQLLLAEVSQKIAQAQAKTAAAQETAQARRRRQQQLEQVRADRAAARQQRELQALARQQLAELDKERARMLALMKQSYPKGELKAAYIAGIVDEQFVREALHDELFTDQAIQINLDLWNKERPNAPFSTPQTPLPG